MTEAINFTPDYGAKENSSMIKVIGVGGAGSNAVQHMFLEGIKGVDFLICNTDERHLEACEVPEKLLIGNGSGAGGNAKVAGEFAEKSEDRIKELQEFALDFQEQLREAKEIYQQNKDKSKIIEPKYIKTENAKSKLHLDKNIEDKKKLNRIKKIEKIKMNQHWVPNCLFGKSIDKFERLTHKHFPTSWELVNKNINLKLNFLFIGESPFNKKII